MSYYDDKTEKQMFDFYISLNEKDRRHYAAIESLKIGYGGITYFVTPGMAQSLVVKVHRGLN